MVGDHEHAIAGDTDAAVRSAGRQAGRARALVAPDPAAAAGVEGVALVRRGDVHDAVDDHRRDLQVAGLGHAEQPRRRQRADVRLVDLRQRRIAVPARIAVVRRPAGVAGDRTELRARAAQQVHAGVVGAQLEIGEALVQHDAVQRAAVRRRHRRPGQGRLEAFDAAQVADEPGASGRRHRLWGHALGRSPVPQQRDELGVLEQGQAIDDRRPGVATVAVVAVAHGAARLEDVPAGAALRWLCVSAGRRAEQREEAGGDPDGGPEHGPIIQQTPRAGRRPVTWRDRSDWRWCRGGRPSAGGLRPSRPPMPHWRPPPHGRRRGRPTSCSG